MGLEGPTRMDKNGNVLIQGKRSGDLGYKSNFYGTHQSCPPSAWTWKGHVGSKSLKTIKNTHPGKLGRKTKWFEKYRDRNDGIFNI